MLVTSEWSQRTAMVTFTLEAHRGRVVAAKLVAGLLLALIVSLIATASAFVVNAVYAVRPRRRRLALRLPDVPRVPAHADDRDADRDSPSRRCCLNTPAAIVVYFAYSFIVPTIFAIAAQFLDWFKDVQPWVDFTQAQQPLIDAQHDRQGLGPARWCRGSSGWSSRSPWGCGGSCAPR